LAFQQPLAQAAYPLQNTAKRRAVSAVLSACS
jgi:hypothetical protein